MLHQLATATKIAGLTYRLLSTTTLIGFLIFGVVSAVQQHRRR